MNLTLPSLTVKQLIESLQRCQPDDVVYFYYNSLKIKSKFIQPYPDPNEIYSVNFIENLTPGNIVLLHQYKPDLEELLNNKTILNVVEETQFFVKTEAQEEVVYEQF